MKFDQPAGTNPIDQLKVVGRPTDRIDGPKKTTGTAPYAAERHGFGVTCEFLTHRGRGPRTWGMLRASSVRSTVVAIRSAERHSIVSSAP